MISLPSKIDGKRVLRLHFKEENGIGKVSKEVERARDLSTINQRILIETHSLQRLLELSEIEFSS